MSATMIALCLSTALLIYPFVIYPLVLRILPAWRPGPTGAHLRRLGPTRFALIFAVRNEAKNLPDTIRTLRQLKELWPEVKIVVWDDDSADHSARLLRAAGDIFTLRRGSRQIGKSAALRHLLEEVEAEVVIMMDANIRFRPEQLLRMRAHFRDPGLGAVSASSRPFGGAASAIGRAYWALEEFVKREETRTGSIIGCDGALWAIRRELFGPVASGAADDFQPSVEAMAAGWRVISDPGIVVKEAAIPDFAAPRRAWRIAAGAWAAHCEVWPQVWRRGGLTLFKYVSHKLIRWFSGLWLALSGLFALALAAEMGWLAEVVTLAASAGLLGWMGVSPFAGMVRMAATFVGTTLGVMHAMRGRRVERWAPIRHA